MALLNLVEERQDKLSSASDARQRERVSIWIDNKRVVYVQAAEALADKLAKEVSPAEYGILADELWSDSNFSRGIEYAKRSIEVSRSKVDKSVACRHLASLYFQSSPLKDLSAGRRYYRKAIDLMRGAADGYSVYVQGHGYQQWGLDELRSGSEAEGLQKIELARQCYTTLPAGPGSFKENLLEWLDLAVQDLRSSNAQEPNTARSSASFSGEGMSDPRGRSTE